MNPITISVAQFQPRNGDKAYNLSVIRKLAKKAKSLGADVISFHEMSITAYTFTKDLNLEQITDLAEEIPNGNSTQELIGISKELDIAILAGLVEKSNNEIFNTYICATPDGMVAKYRKLHPFINKHMSAGKEYCVFDLYGWKCGILICYDNNIIENVRATSLLGAELIFAPHVTGCTPSAMPHRGFVDNQYWLNRENDPVSLRMEFDGPKGRRWLMRWLPARAYDNGVYYAFTNPIGYDGEHLKNGNSMIIDPYGEVLSEIKSFEDEITLSKITKEKIELSGGWRYKNARRPELYKDIIGRDHKSDTTPIWLKNSKGE
ncbi:nitrilase family protein [Muricauda sp. NFXS6]|uniref:nitrilase family protein n=1 Tax=Flavobacteriaceae TaxID=49546 RepID=UPI0032DF802D|tara:strand:- start:3750 stop:4706 length:957 start_codon:yes stop_codon:yes gene_type:complete